MEVMRVFDVLCISDCCCDLIFRGLPQVPSPGTEAYCQEFFMQAGGGANTPMGLARLGCRTAYVTAVGDDALGEIVCRDMAASGVSSACIQKNAGVQTWVSAVLSTPDDRAFASYAGKGVSLTKAALEKLTASVRWVHTYTCYCERFPFIPEVCARNNVPLSLDAAFGEKTVLGDMQPLLAQTTLFTPNDREAYALTGEEDPYRALKKIAGVCENVVVTMGKAGCMAVIDGQAFKARGPVVRMADATGAGDLFAAGLIAARLKGAGAEAQLRFAAASGALCATWPGGVNGRYSSEKVAELAQKVTVSRL